VPIQGKTTQVRESEEFKKTKYDIMIRADWWQSSLKADHLEEINLERKRLLLILKVVAVANIQSKHENSHG